ncbi:two-component response regulator ARR14-like [Neltuma alba]|uniref:two-component response regulator ARR14-like n=1 Tax=Neltuma alba TaxID=207710 RepID=UPI0010A3D947|nr:two-component response regulator ARR14-like [Prosopis alba]
MGFDTNRVDESTQNILSIPNIKVLVVEGDSACLAVTSKILHSLGYEGVIAAQGSSALSIVEQMKNKLHFVLMEVHLPDMGRHEIIKKMREACSLPFFIMSADAKHIPVVGASAEGAEHHFIKPVMVADLRGLWQFTARRDKTDKAMEVDKSKGNKNIPDKGIRLQPCLETGNRSLQRAKRKEPEPLDKAEEGETIELKRQKLTWAFNLHHKFMESIGLLGVSACPKKILEHLNVPGLIKDAVSSYFQKFHLSLKQEEKETKDSFYLHQRSGHLSQTNYLQVSEQQYATHQTDSFSNCANDPISFAYMHCPDASNFLPQEIWTCQESNYGQNQLTPGCNNAQDILMLTNTAPSEKEYAGSSRVESGEGIFESDSFLSHFGYNDEGNEMLYSTMLASYMDQLLLKPLLPFPLPPFMVEEYGMLEDIHGLIDFPKGADQFSDDEDFKLWLSTL